MNSSDYLMQAARDAVNSSREILDGLPRARRTVEAQLLDSYAAMCLPDRAPIPPDEVIVEASPVDSGNAFLSDQGLLHAYALSMAYRAKHGARLSH